MSEEMEKFIKALEIQKYSYGIKGDSISVRGPRVIDLGGLPRIPSGVTFENTTKNIILRSIEEIPSGVEFRNTGSVFSNINLH
jgi:hypothetical protein